MKRPPLSRTRRTTVSLTIVMLEVSEAKAGICWFCFLLLMLLLFVVVGGGGGGDGGGGSGLVWICSLLICLFFVRGEGGGGGGKGLFCFWAASRRSNMRNVFQRRIC